MKTFLILLLLGSSFCHAQFREDPEKEVTSEMAEYSSVKRNYCETKKLVDQAEPPPGLQFRINGITHNPTGLYYSYYYTFDGILDTHCAVLGTTELLKTRKQFYEAIKRFFREVHLPLIQPAAPAPQYL